MKKGQFAMHKLDFHSTGAGSIAKRRHSGGRRQATTLGGAPRATAGSPGWRGPPR